MVGVVKWVELKVVLCLFCVVVGLIDGCCFVGFFGCCIDWEGFGVGEEIEELFFVWFSVDYCVSYLVIEE